MLIWPVGQSVKTLASHAENMGSIPVRVTKTKEGVLLHSFFCFAMRTASHEPIPAPSGIGVAFLTKDASS